MGNCIYHCSYKEFESAKRRLQELGDCFFAEIDGKTCRTEAQFYKKISEAMSFPTEVKLFAGFDDWIRDLLWIRQKRIAFVIYNYKSFMSDNVEKRNYIISAFKNDILPWWESDVKKYVVEGTPRQFDVFLVDDCKGTNM